MIKDKCNCLLPKRIIRSSVNIIGRFPPPSHLRHVGQAEGNGAGFDQDRDDLRVFDGRHVSSRCDAITVTQPFDADSFFGAVRMKWNLVFNILE